MSEQQDQTLAVFVLDKGKAARRLLEAMRKVDEIDDNVQIVDAAIVDHTSRLGRVTVHQTEDMGALKGGVHGAAIGVVVGTIVAGPAGAVVAGAAGGLLHSLRSRFHDIGIDDKFMKQVASEIEKGKSALFVQYEGSWAASIGLIEGAIQAENALLIQSTLPAETAAALRALVEPAADVLGGDEVVSDFEVEIEAAPEAAPEEAPEEPAAPVEEAVPVVAAAAVAATDAGIGGAGSDDLTQLVGIGPKAAAALAAAGITTYAALAESNEPQLRHALHEADMMPPGNVATWPMQASYAVKGDWQGLMRHNQKATAARAPGKPSAPAAEAVKADDLTQIHGIGPRIASILNDGGITTFAQLEHANTGDLRQIIAVGGALPPSSLDTWPTQASYAARGDWSGLATYNQRH